MYKPNLAIVFGMAVSLFLGASRSQAEEIKNLQMKTCQSDKEKCFEIKAGSAQRDTGGNSYRFKSADVKVLKRGPASEYAPTEEHQNVSGTVDLSKGELVLDSSNSKAMQKRDIRGQ